MEPVTTKQPLIFKTLDVSTCHITEVEDGHLSQALNHHGVLRTGNPETELVVMLANDGYRISVPDAEEFGPVAAHCVIAGCPNVAKLLAVAADHGCWYVDVVADGYTYEDLPTFDW